MAKFSPPKIVWNLYPTNPTLTQKLANSLLCEEPIAQVILNRGLRSLPEAKAFLHPENTVTESFSNSDLSQAATLIKTAIQDNKHIFLFGDYDVDGMSSTSIILKALAHCHARLNFHIPNRFTEGYGLTQIGVETIMQQKADLLILLDCGITNYHEIKALKTHNPALQIMILDHHTTPKKSPEADLILNPKDLPVTHPCRNLCTAGIAYTVMAHFLKTYYPERSDEDFLDLAALGTVADVVPLIGENRRLTKLGLSILSKRKNLGVQKLLSQAKCSKKTLCAKDIGFVIAPRLNASGRLTHAKKGVDLLTATNSKDATYMATELETLNLKRRALGEHIFKQANAMVKETKGDDQPVIALSHEAWHSGIIGITAAQLVRHYQRPVIVMAEDGLLARGSARSINGIDIYSLLNACSHLFQNFGGHKEAAGFSIEKEKIPTFQKTLLEVSRKQLAGLDLTQVIDVDSKIQPKDLTLNFARSLQALEPFGMGNPEPILYTDALHAIDCKSVGDGSHLKATFSDDTGRYLIEGIGFGLADKLPILYQKKVSLLFHLTINEWLGKETPQLELIDLK